jgi:hypothetical protein
VEAADNGPGHIVEAGFDAFQVIDSANAPPPLKIEDMADGQPGLIIFPNPFHGKFQLGNIKGVSIEKIEIYNILGEKVFDSRPLPGIYGGKPWEIDLSGEPSGVYFVKVSSKTGSEMIRAVKQ